MHLTSSVGSIRYAFSDGTQQLSGSTPQSTSQPTSQVDRENEDDEQDEDEETDDSEEDEDEDNVQIFPYNSSGIATQQVGGSSSHYGGRGNSAALVRSESQPFGSSLDRHSTASVRSAGDLNNGTRQTRQYQTFSDPSRLENQEPIRTAGGAWALGGAAFGAIIFASGVYVGSTIKASATFSANAAAVRRRQSTSGRRWPRRSGPRADHAADHTPQRNPTHFFVLGKVRRAFNCRMATLSNEQVFAVFLSTRTDVTPFIPPALDQRATAPSEMKQHFFVVTAQQAHLFYCS